MPPRGSRPRPSLLLLTLVLCALAVGAAVSLLASARTAGPPPPVGPTAQIAFPSWVDSVVIIGFALAIILPVVYARMRVTSAGPLNRPFVVGALCFLLAAVIVVEIARIFGSGGGGFQTVTGAGGNNSTGSNGTGTLGNHTVVPGPGGVLNSLNLSLPSWTLFVVVAVICVGLVVAALPRLSEFVQGRREGRLYRERSAQVAARVHAALGEAARDLESALDPRATILALYGTLLVRLEPLVMDLDRATAEEIRELHLTRLGIRETAAMDLTRVFEEARYSSHPLGRAEVERATAAIRAAMDDLSKSVPDR